MKLSLPTKFRSLRYSYTLSEPQIVTDLSISSAAAGFIPLV